jgi:hypothetical protein
MVSMFDIAQNLLNISKHLKKDEFDIVKNSFKKLMLDISGINLMDTEFILDKNMFKIKTLGAKRAQISMFLSEIQDRMKENQSLALFTLRV